MAYTKNNIFPLTEVYALAPIIGGEFSRTVQAIRGWKVYPKSLESYNGFSQVRRALCYKALQDFGQWAMFRSQYWPTANTRRAQGHIKELENDFISNGKLARYKCSLPPQAQRLIP